MATISNKKKSELIQLLIVNIVNCWSFMEITVHPYKSACGHTK